MSKIANLVFLMKRACVQAWLPLFGYYHVIIFNSCSRALEDSQCSTIFKKKSKIRRNEDFNFLQKFVCRSNMWTPSDSSTRKTKIVGACALMLPQFNRPCPVLRNFKKVLQKTFKSIKAFPVHFFESIKVSMHANVCYKVRESLLSRVRIRVLKQYVRRKGVN